MSSARRALSLVLCLGLVLGAAGCGGDGDGGSGSSTDDTSEDGSSDGKNGSTDTSIGPGGPGTDAAGVPTTRPLGSPGKDGKTPATVGRQRRPGVPAPGRYLYNTGTDGSGRKAFDVYEDKGQTAEETYQLETWTDKDSADRYVVIWRKDAKVLDREQSATPDQNGQLAAGPLCDWSTDVPFYKLPFAVGTSWNASTSCGEGSDKKDRTMTAKVTSNDTLTVVDGESVPVVVIERVVTDTQSLGGLPFVTRTTTTEFVSPALGLPVRVTGSIVKSLALKESTSNFRLDLRSTKPTPLPE